MHTKSATSTGAPACQRAPGSRRCAGGAAPAAARRATGPPQPPPPPPCTPAATTAPAARLPWCCPSGRLHRALRLRPRARRCPGLPAALRPLPAAGRPGRLRRSASISSSWVTAAPTTRPPSCARAHAVLVSAGCLRTHCTASAHSYRIHWAGEGRQASAESREAYSTTACGTSQRHQFRHRHTADTWSQGQSKVPPLVATVTSPSVRATLGAVR